MNWATRVIKTAIKGFQMRFNGSPGWSMLFMGRTRYDYARDVGDGTASSIVIACVMWIARTFPEAPLQIAEVKEDGTRTIKRDHPLIALLEQPNPFYSGVLLWMATLLDFTTGGNAYWIKIRNGQGRVIQLWWAPAYTVEPRWATDGSDYISYYEYNPAGLPLRIETKNIVHFRNGLDPRNPRKGLSPLGSLLREIFTDDEAANFSASILKNLGIPGVILSPDAPDVDMGNGEKMKDDFQSKFSGDKRGEPLILKAQIKAQVLSFNPQQMDLKTLRRLPEERISAVFGIPAIVAGLGAGLDRSTFANMKEAREMAYEGNIIPTQRLLAAEIKAQLLRDFGDINGIEVIFDLSQVRVLQEDENAKAERLGGLVKNGVIMRSEARSGMGYKVEKRDEVYHLPISIIEVGPGAPEVEVTPALTPARTGGSEAGDGSKTLTLSGEVLAKARRWQSQMEGRVEKAVTRYLNSQYEKAAQAIENNKARKDAPPLQNALDDGSELQRLFAKFYPLMLQKAYDDAEAVLGVGIPFDLDNPYVQDVLEELGLLIKEDIPLTTIADIQALVGRQADEGWSVETLAEKIRELKEVKSPVRARLIAVTETARGYSLGSKIAYLESDVVAEIEWLVTQPCKVCEQNAGKRVALEGGVFPSGHELPPAHPGCKCAVAPVVKVKVLPSGQSKARRLVALEVFKTERGVDVRRAA